MADTVGTLTPAAPLLAPPLAVVVGAARVLGAAGTSASRLRALCEHLRNTLPADEVRLRSGERRAGVPREPAADLFAVAVPWRTDQPAVLEVLGSRRPPAELRPVLEAVAALLATVLPVLEEGSTDEQGLERRLARLTIDSLPVGLYVVDRQYQIVVWNRKRETGTQGLRRDDVIGRPVVDVLHRQDAAALLAEFDHVFRTGEVFETEQEVSADTERRIFRTSRLPMRLEGDGISHVITIGEDVTETRALQRAMQQTEKLAAVGQLAAGVMHEINNPLATIGACVAAISSRLGASAEPVVREYLDIIESEVVRCTNIVDGLLDFSRAGRAGGAMEPTDIHGVIERTLYLLKHHQRFRRLQVIRDFTEPLPQVMGNAERLIQAAMAILLNAADATGGRGQVVVRTRVEGTFVVVEFQDDGPGIPPDVLPKVFEPFYTTKGPARGTGLGLAICYGIVADHQGRLDVRSESSRGSVFRMALPIAREGRTS
ncbi:MAG: PAS domain-containing protein [Gemmatimonadales bacterium]|nr:PAS domain-containing protein [Gemmatimonadales bacterium]